jgi:hemolysin activation/secretion protein
MTGERHLILQELTLPPAAEWSPQCHGWVMVRVADGTGYWLQHGADARQFAVGDGMIAHNTAGVIRASQLGSLKLQFFTIQPQHLNGVLTVTEWHQLETDPGNTPAHISFFSGNEPTGQKFSRLADQSRSEGLPMRCALLQLWAGAVTGFLSAPMAAHLGDNKLRERFRHLVGRMSEAELSECSLGDLAKQLYCSERHFSRLFREEFGVPFRARQIELRLQRARQLLTDSNAKIINVAYESGYQHLGLFNAMFKRRFGTTPGKWRQQNARKNPPAKTPNQSSNPASRAGILLLFFVLNFFLPAFAQTNPPAAIASQNAGSGFHVEKYLVFGNSVLTTGDISGIFTNAPAAFGANATAEGICEVLNGLQTAYHERGFASAIVHLPRQEITNATVKIEVTENKFAATVTIAGSHFFNPDEIIRSLGSTPEAGVVSSNGDDELQARAHAALLEKMAELDAEENKPKLHIVPVSTNAGPKFAVEKYIVAGNSILTPGNIGGVFTNVAGAFGTNVTFDAIRAALGDLQIAYRERGYVTVSVALPQQKLTNAAVKVQVIEGRLAAINVTGNRWFSSNNVMRALPGLHTNMLFNSYLFQHELDAANLSRDRQIYPVIGPGPDPGTSELTLKVKDVFPLHARVDINNEATPNTPDLRANLNVQYDNLWDLEHQVGFQYGGTPMGFKGENNYTLTPFDDPLVANYSAYYRMPLGGYSSMQNEVDSNPGSFGYNEVTHQFNLPPPAGRPEITFYASRSTSDTGVQLGQKNFLTDTTATNNSGVVYHPLSIVTNSAGDNITLNEDAGSKISFPLPLNGKMAATLSFGVDYKRYRQTSYNTNENFFQTEFFQNGNEIMNDFPAPQPEAPTFQGADYFPFNVGLSGSVPDKLGTTFFSATANFTPFAMSVHGIYTTKTIMTKTNTITETTLINPHYVTLQFSADRLQTIYKDWTMKLHADGQWASTPLISNEQFGMGGTSGVRGYTTGEAYGDEGWRVSIEPQTPSYNIGMVGNEGRESPCWLRSSVFTDYGEIYQLDPALGQSGRERFWGAGWGVTLNVGTHFDARIQVACPLLTTKLTPAGDFHFYAGMGLQF